MANKTGVKTLTDVLATIITGGLGTQGVLYGLVFKNTTASERTVTIEHFRADTGETNTVDELVPARGRTKWPAPFGVLPGDTIKVRADIAGVKAVWSYNEDLGDNPILTGLRFVGAYSGAANYIPNDVVLVNGFSYVAMQNTTAQAPVAGMVTAYWYPLTSSEMVTALGGGKLDSAGGTMTGPLFLAADASSNMQPVTKQQFDAALLGVRKRNAVRVATNANVNITTALNAGDTIDAIVLAAGDLVLVRAQTIAADNGIYVVGPAPERSSEFDTYNEHAGALVIVQEGTQFADAIFMCLSNLGGTLGTTGITFQQIPSSVASYTASGGIQIATLDIRLAIDILANKAVPISSDYILLFDSADNTHKKVLLSTLPVSAATQTAIADAIAAGGGGGGGIGGGAGSLGGMGMSNTPGNTTTHITIGSGIATDSTYQVSIALTTPITKRLDLNWSVGSSNGGRDNGTLAAGQTWHCYVIHNPTSGIVDAIFSQSATTPTLPAGFTRFRRIGSIMLEAVSTSIRQFVQMGDWFMLKLRSADYAAASNGSGPYLRTITVPDGIKVEAKMYFQSAGTVTSGATGWLSGIYDPDFGVPPAFGPNTQWAQVRRQSQQLSDNSNASYAACIVTQFTNKSRQIYTYSNDTQDIIVLGVLGWRDDRGRTTDI